MSVSTAGAFPARQSGHRYTPCRRRLRTVVPAGHDTVLLERGRGDGFACGTVAGCARYCIALPVAWTATGRSLGSSRGSGRTGPGPRTDIARRSSWYRRRDRSHQCPERPFHRPVESPVHRQEQSRVGKLGRGCQSRRTTGPTGPVSCSRANSERQRFPAGAARCGRICRSTRSRPVSQAGTARPIRRCTTCCE